MIHVFPFVSQRVMGGPPSERLFLNSYFLNPWASVVWGVHEGYALNVHLLQRPCLLFHSHACKKIYHNDMFNHIDLETDPVDLSLHSPGTVDYCRGACEWVTCCNSSYPLPLRTRFKLDLTSNCLTMRKQSVEEEMQPGSQTGSARKG